MTGTRRRRTHGGSRTAGALTLVSGWILMPAGGVLDILALGLEHAGTGGVLRAVLGPIAGIVVGAAGIGLILLGRRLRRLGKRMLSAITSVPDVLARPPFVLYLRSFTDDSRFADTRVGINRNHLAPHPTTMQGVHTEEEQLRVAVAPFGRMVAVGRPGERLPEIGARRLYLRHDDWQESVLALMKEASRTGLVLMGAGVSESLRWEFGQAVATVPPRRLVLVVPLRSKEYQEFRTGVGEVFPKTLPGYPGGPRLLKYGAAIRGAIYFDDDWTAHFVRFDVKGAVGNFQRLIESKFIYGMRPVYERLTVSWPGMRMLPRRLGITRRQFPVVFLGLGVPLALLVLIIWKLISTFLR